MTSRFRNIDFDSSLDPDDWPFEAVLTAVERGCLSDWRRLSTPIRRSPWGSCARAVEQISSWGENYGADRLFTAVIEHARSEADAEPRRDYGRRIRAVRAGLGMSMREFAPLIGTSPARLASYESGKVAPTANILGRVDRVTLERSSG